MEVRRKGGSMCTHYSFNCVNESGHIMPKYFSAGEEPRKSPNNAADDPTCYNSIPSALLPRLLLYDAGGTRGQCGPKPRVLRDRDQSFRWIRGSRF
jgi:hypothetical protein